MRYLGNKTSLINEIYSLLNDKGLVYSKLTLFDAFCGTGSVGVGLKSAYNLVINDNLEWCTKYVFGRLCTHKVEFKNLSDPFETLNNLTAVKGFFYINYSPGGSERMYFTASNGGKIDAIRQQIDDWFRNGVINDEEFSYLFYCLVEAVSKVSNTTGVYGAFLKHWDPRSQKELILERLVENTPFDNKVKVFNRKIEEIIQDVECDVLYIDPPYTQNQYGTQYHILETLLKYDNPSISPITGSRRTAPMRSDWSKDVESHVLFEKVIAKTKAKHIVFSYSKDGFLKKDYIENVLKRHGKSETLVCKKIGYKKYRNFKNRSSDGHFEYLFYVEKREKHQVYYESPLNYTGSKFRAIDKIAKILPSNINKFYDVFGGGFNVGVNVDLNNCSEVVYNDINEYVVSMHKYFATEDETRIIKNINKLISRFSLEPKDKPSYYQLRDYYNSLNDKVNHPVVLFTTIMYSFQQQIRFNNNHGFNNPVGMRWFNNRIKEKTVSYSRRLKEGKFTFLNKDYLELEPEICEDDFVYLDPPYMLTTGAYNDGKRGFKGWDIDQETEFLSFVNRLNNKGVKFLLSYVIEHNGNRNDRLIHWIDSNEFSWEYLDIKFANSKSRKEIILYNFEVGEEENIMRATIKARRQP